MNILANYNKMKKKNKQGSGVLLQFFIFIVSESSLPIWVDKGMRHEERDPLHDYRRPLQIGSINSAL